ncbi:MAG: glycosyltransferase [Bdellovibrionales bacterium]|nr:glycosyltransferase [Bdellovibrionales bacterium]
MRILHISKYYHPFRGGIEKMIQELAEGSVEAGHQVRVLCSAESPQSVQEEIEGVEVHRLGRWGVLWSQALAPSFFTKMSEQIEWADVIHFHMPNPLVELAFLFHDCKKPLVVTYHCEVVRQRKLMHFYRPVARKILQRASKIVVSTPYHINFSPGLRGFENQCEIIPFGITGKLSQLNRNREEIVQRLRNEYGDFFLFVGRLVPYKGVDVLLHAMKFVPRNLLIVGEGPRFEQWVDLRNQLSLQDKVHFLGKVESDDEFSALIHACEALVLPSVDESEAFGIVMIEAMSCKKAVVSTKLKSGVSWVNQDGVTGVAVTPKDFEALADGMNALVCDQKRKHEMENAAFQRYEELFQLDAMVTSYLNLYQSFFDTPKKASQTQNLKKNHSNMRKAL